MTDHFKHQVLDLVSTEELENELLLRATEDDLSDNELWGAALQERPADDAEGWAEPEDIRGSGGFLGGLIGSKISAPPVFTDPETGQKWQDYAKQKGSPDWYWICSGAMDVGADVWNTFWLTPEKRNAFRAKQKVGPEAGIPDEEYVERNPVMFGRLRDYDGTLNENPHDWPEPFRSVYLESRED